MVAMPAGPPPPPPENPSRNTAAYALFVLFGINAMNFYDRQIFAAVTEPIRKQWGLSDAAIGFMGTAFTLLYAAAGVPLGRLADRSARARLLAGSVTVWSLLTAASGLCASYAALFSTRILAGLGEAACAPAGNALIGDLYPPHRRSRALGIFMMGLPIGICLSYWVSGTVAHAYGWRAAFFVACAPGLLFGFLARYIKEPRRGASEGRAAPAGPPPAIAASPYRRILRIPTMGWIIVSGALQTFNMYALNSFLTAFLGRYHGMDLRRANRVSAVVLGAVGVLGLWWGGRAADWAQGRRPDGRLRLAALCLLLSAPCIYLALLVPRGAVPPFMVLLGAGSMLMFVYYATVYAAIQDVIVPELRATAMAIYFFAMYVLGASLGPLGTGLLSDRFAQEAMRAAGASQLSEAFRAEGLHRAMLVIPLLALLLSLVLYAASRTVVSDMKRRAAWPDRGPDGMDHAV